ncbi:MAG TPA: SGNH/GDSL hydrolase family protein [Gemmatimonadaceae bacterium]|nr:SGNH/GDSL hydrolase family protein [Gemmatimonadaceae bacterium]
MIIRRNTGRRAFLLAPLAFAAAVSVGCGRTHSADTAPVSARAGSQWFATWTSSQLAGAGRPPADSIDRRPDYVNRTVREIVHASIGGDRVRLRLSNEYGDKPLVIGRAHVALRDTGSAVVGSSDRAVTFGGRAGITIRPGAIVVSDPVSIALPALGDLAVSLFLVDSPRLRTIHALGLQTTYISRTGDFSATQVLPTDTTLAAFLFLSSVEVTNNGASGVIVTIGNSITDGLGSTRNMNRRWPNILAQRLLSSGEPAKGIANSGISGNRVLSFGTGPSALARFDRDVLMVPGVTHVIVLEGINDIGRSIADSIGADDIIYGLRQLAERAHDRGLMMFGATLTPAGPRQNFTPQLEAVRQAVNAFIRTGGVFDGVIDFDAVTRDPADATRFLLVYDSGDHLHPSDAGYKAMGDAIDLTLFRRQRPR